MAKDRPFLATLNGGEISPLAIARVDLARMQFTAETMINVIPRVIGPMQFRPGLGYTGSTANNNQARNIPFVFAADDTALVEVSDQAMRFIIADTPLSRVDVATQVTNGDFSSATGWTLTTINSSVATISGGVLTLATPRRGSTTLAKRSVTVAGSDINKEHGLRIVVTRGPVKFRCGSTDGGDDYIRETDLNTGTYSLAFTPTGASFFVQFSVKSEVSRIVDLIQVETIGNGLLTAAGVVSLSSPWTASELPKLRWDQSGDVIFVADTTRTNQPMRIERRSARSWGLAFYEFADGPFKGKTANVKLNPSNELGNISLTADAPFFRAEHVGALFELSHNNIDVDVFLAGDDEYSDHIIVSGIDTTTNEHRLISYSVSGTWAGSLTLQFSYDQGLTWAPEFDITANQSSASYKVAGDNAEVWVRWGFIGGDWTSGSARCQLHYNGGSGSGVVRVTAFTSSTSVSAEVLKRLYNGDATDKWQEGRYSNAQGWPSVVGLFEGRLWFLDNDKVNGSVSDDFTSFDVNEEGDSGPIIRSIANGPVNKGLWMLGLARLIMGTVGAEAVGRSSSFDEPITPENFSIKDASTLGSADVMAVKVDRTGVFIQRNGKRAYAIRFDVDSQDYAPTDVTRYNTTILGSDNVSVAGVAVQRQPDTRLWFWLTDGSVACLVYDPSEDVLAWCRFTTDGDVEDIAVLPNEQADDVYMVVKRFINGQTVRFRERLAYDHQALGGVDNFISDSYVTVNIVGTTTITGLSHLEGESVVAWVEGAAILDADGEPEEFTVTGGQINIGGSNRTGQAVVGLPYEGFWKSTKLAYGAQMGTAVSQTKIIKDLAPILYNTHLRGFRYGRDFDNLADLPLVIGGETQAFDTILTSYDASTLTFEGTWDTDSRICIAMRSPLPCTVLGIAGAVLTHETG